MGYLVTILVTSVLLVTVSSNPWNDPTSNQFHIQTDEGPERYFKYQTQNGQYRKEKRLEDGTVIGSYAWIDDNGYLRQRDYIADNQGYRIVKNKNVFVGRNINVGDAVKAAKKIPNTYIPPGGYNTPSSVANRGFVAVTPRPVLTVSSVAPAVEISLNAIPSSTTSSVLHESTTYGSQSSTDSYFQTSTVRPLTSTQGNFIPVSSSEGVSSSSYIPPISSTTYTPPTSTIAPPIYLPPTPENNLAPPLPEYNTPRPPTYIPPSPTPYPSSVYLPSFSSSTPPPFNTPSTPGYINITPPPRKYIPTAINTNSIEYSGSPQYEHYPEDFINPYIHQNGPTYPIDRRGQSFNPTYNNIGNGYDPQYPYYDGISVTNDGFRYYIPKAYHEEQNTGSDTKSGSFGYVDPFGIRRVIYYNAGPDGFKHRKNNRYVGHNATPYDPRPY